MQNPVTEPIGNRQDWRGERAGSMNRRVLAKKLCSAPAIGRGVRASSASLVGEWRYLTGPGRSGRHALMPRSSCSHASGST